MNDSHSSVIASAKKFFSGTLLSRVMGMVRDLSMAFCFGGAPQVAAFMVAYRLANLLRRLFGESALQGGFVPHFELLRNQNEAEAIRFYRDLKLSMILVVGAIIALGMLFCGLFSSDILFMMLLMLPGVLFLTLYALDSAVLQCGKKYFLSASAPALFNLVWIVSAFALRQWEIRSAMFALSASIFFAFGAQWWVTARPVIRWSRSSAKTALRPFSSEVRALFKPFSYGLIGIGASQINSALDALFAAWSDPSGPAYLWYAIRIQQLPLALLGIALANALLPPLSRAAQAGSWERYQELLQKALRKCTVLLLPCMVGMILFAEFGVSLLYQHGAFLKSDALATSRCLQAYALGLVPTAYVLLLANGFYARKEYHWPMRCSLISIASNVVLNTLFVFEFSWGPSSIALATSLSSFLNCLLLYKRSVRRDFSDLKSGS